MSWSSELGLTDKDVKYILSSDLLSLLLDIMAYGMYTGVYFVALYLTLSRGGDSLKRPRIGSAALITVLWLIVTVHMGIMWSFLDYQFIQNGESQETQFKSMHSSMADEAAPQDITNITATFSSVLLADVIMIWRCWVLYGRRWLVIILPVLSLITGSVCDIIRIVWRYTLDDVSRPDEDANMLLIYLSGTVFTNVYCTTAIISRVVSISGWKKSFKTYRGLLEILIESSILYTASYLLLIGLIVHAQYFAKGLDLRSWFSEAVGWSITGLVPTLIIARVAAGHARPDDSWTDPSLPDMRSTVRSLAQTLGFAQPSTGNIGSNTDLERNIRLNECDEVFVPVSGQDKSRR